MKLNLLYTIVLITIIIPPHVFSQDTDNDNIDNIIDIDDDNDGILDISESPNCFTFENEQPLTGDRTSTSGFSVFTDMNVYAASPITESIDGVYTTAGNTRFINNQLVAGNTVYQIEFPQALELSNLTFKYANTYGFFNNASIKLQGSNDNTTWTDLNTSATYTINPNPDEDIFSVTQNSAKYKYYRLLGVSGRTYSNGYGELELTLAPGYNAHDYPKNSCSDDFDGDGIYNHLDLDSDGDGCSDGVEASNTTVTNNDIVNYNTGTDSNNNGLLDIFEDLPANPGSINYLSTYSSFAMSNFISVCVDTDGDSITDISDIDDDNDGILDISESPNCFTFENEQPLTGDRTSTSGFSVFTDMNVYAASPITESIDGVYTTAGNTRFINNQLVAGNTVYQIEFPQALELSNLTFKYANTYGFFNNASIKLQGSNDNTTWTDLNTSATYTINPNPDEDIFSVTQNSAKYKYYRLLGVSGRTYSNGYGELELTLAPGYNAHDYPKNSCSDDFDGDGIYNHLDLDSDGDGCSDDVEASNTTVTNNDIVNYNTGTDSNNNGLLDIFEDLPANPGSINYLSTYSDFALKDSVSACVDTDGDGIYDITDIDDDNDGVLDIAEKNCFIPIQTNPSDLSWHGTAAANMTSPNPTTLQVTGNAWANAYSDQTWSLPITIEGSITATINGMIGILPVSSTETSSWNDGGYKFQFNAANGMYIRHGTATQTWQAPSIVGTTFKLDVDALGNMTYTHNGNVIYTGTIPLTEYKITISRGSFNAEDFSITGVNETFDSNLCEGIDTDGDTIYNHLDLDSDGDGCSDGVEASNTTVTNNDIVNYNTGTDSNNNGLLDIFEDLPANPGSINYLSTYSSFAMSNFISVCVDTDGDSITDISDIDDDNDGILDISESPNCFTFENEQPLTGDRTSTSGFSVFTDMNVYAASPITESIDGVYTTAGNTRFINNQLVAGNTVYQIEFPQALELSNLTFKYANTYGFFNNASIKLQGSNDNTTWTDLNTSATYTINPNPDEDIFSVTQNSAKYKYYRLLGVSGRTYSNGYGELELTLAPGYNAHDYPKNSCSDDFDGDGIYNHLDLDSDGDGCSDGVEASNTTVTNNDIVNYNTGTDSNNNGLLDIFEDLPANPGSINYLSTYSSFAMSNFISVCVDTDGDSITDISDIDDDNDGILDISESPNCFTFENEQPLTGDRTSTSGFSVFTDMNVYAASPITESIDGVYTTAGNTRFINNQLVAGNTVYQIEFPQALELSNLTFKYANTYGFFNNASIKLQGSNDNTTWTDLNTSATYTINPNPDEDIFSVTQNSAKYKYYRLLGVSGRTYSNGYGELELTLAPGYNAHDYPKNSCSDDFDGDGIYNHLDLDSDDDGCSDSVEAGNTIYTSNDIVNINSGTDANNNGLLDSFENGTTGNINYTSTYNSFALNNTINACTDTDGDSIADVIDIDDDNDGILDLMEKNCFVSSTSSPEDLTWHGSAAGNVTAPTPTTLNVSGAAWANAYTDQQWNLPITIEGTVTAAVTGMIGLLPINSTETSSWNDGGYKFQFNAANGMYIRHGTATQTWQAPSIVGTTFKLDVDALGNMTYTHNGNVIYTGTIPLTEYKITISRGSFNAENFSITGVNETFDSNLCEGIDTDGDTIYNHLDLDSDDDGCSDSVEAGNTIYTSNDIVNYNSGTDTNNNGLLDSFEDLPANPGTINYTSTYNDYALIDVLNACADTDNDGVFDLVDIDDDNDGVLDIDEQSNCEYIAKDISTLTFNGTAFASATSNTLTPNNTGGWRSSYSDQEMELPIHLEFKVTERSNAGMLGLSPVNGTQTLTNWSDSAAKIYPYANRNYGYFNGVTWAFNLPSSSGQLYEIDIDSSGNVVVKIDGVTTYTYSGPVVNYNLVLSSYTTPKQYTDIKLTGKNSNLICYDDIDTDNDSIPNRLDLDSDDDGCPDALETGFITTFLENGTLPDGNPVTSTTFTNGQVTGPYGNNGLANSIEFDDTALATISASSYILGSSSYITDALDDMIFSDCSLPTSIDFNGTDNYLSTTGFISGYSKITMMAWIKLDASFNSDGVIAGQEMFNISVDASQTAHVNLITDANTTVYQASSSSTIDKDIWHHITAIYDGANSNLKIYINGELETENTSVPSSILSTNVSIASSNFAIGRDEQDTTNYLHGFIDEVRVFDLALTDDQVQQMVYQEIVQNGANVRGAIIPKDIEDRVTDTYVPWSNLQAYYPMTTVVSGETLDESSNTRNLELHSITTEQEQTAPMPYETTSDGTWDTTATWLHGDVWDITDIPNNKDWSIIHIKNNLSTASTHTNLGFIIDADKEFDLNADNAITNTWYVELNGTIDFLGDSQLIQGEYSDLVTSATGKILRRQEGQISPYRYNYWSSPVGIQSAKSLINENTSANNTNNTTFNLDMLKDGNGVDIPFTSALNENGKVSTRWLYSFLNGVTYSDWVSLTETSNINPGISYTQKGTGNSGTEQQYIFEGKPNNGTVLITANDTGGGSGPTESVAGNLTTSLIGNPYPSSIDAHKFIDDNASTIGGTLYLWEQWAGDTHVLDQYQGGYATLNKTAKIKAYQFEGLEGDNNGSQNGSLAPTQYLAVAQGFSVEIIENGNIEFNNAQRIFKKEVNGESQFFRNATNANEGEETEEMKLLQLQFILPNGLVREIALGFSNHTTQDFDYGYDGKMNTINENDIYTILEGEEMIIQAYSMYNDDTEIPLHYVTTGNASITIKVSLIENFDENQPIFLRDNFTNTFFDLRDSTAYEFTSDSGIFSNRFDIVFKDNNESLSVIDNTLDEIRMFINKNQLFVKGTYGTAKTLKLVNASGQVIFSHQGIDAKTMENGIDISNLSSGIYIVEIITAENHHKSKKVIIE